METILPSSPASYQQLIKSSLALYRASFTRIILLAFLLSLVTFTPRLLSYVIGQDLFFELPLLSPYRLWMVIIDIAALVFFIAILWRMHCVMRGVREPLIEDFKIGFRKVCYVFIAAIIQSAVILAFASIILVMQIFLAKYPILFMQHWTGMALGMTFLFGQTILLAYICVLFVFFTPLIAIENKGVLPALERSMSLAWNHWWSIFSTQITPWLVYLVALMIMQDMLHLDIHIYLLEQGSHNIWASLIHLTIFALFIPWVAALLLIQLQDIELRKKMITK